MSNSSFLESIIEEIEDSIFLHGTTKEVALNVFSQEEVVKNLSSGFPDHIEDLVVGYIKRILERNMPMTPKKEILTFFGHKKVTEYLGNVSSKSFENIFLNYLTSLIECDAPLDDKVNLFTITSDQLMEREDEFASLVFDVAKNTKNVQSTKKVQSLIEIYQDYEYACEEICEFIDGNHRGISPEFLSIVVDSFSLPETREVIDFYKEDKNYTTCVTEVILKPIEIASVDNVFSYVKRVVGILNKYLNTPYSDNVVFLTNLLFGEIYDEKKLSKTINFIEKCDKNNLNPRKVREYFDRFAGYFTDEEFRYSLTTRNINNLTAAYQLVKESCKSWGIDEKATAKDEFIKVMNEKVETGSTLEEKRKILDTWSNNVYRTIMNHPEQLNFMRLVA